MRWVAHTNSIPLLRSRSVSLKWFSEQTDFDRERFSKSYSRTVGQYASVAFFETFVALAYGEEQVIEYDSDDEPIESKLVRPPAPPTISPHASLLASDLPSPVSVLLWRS